MTTIQPARRKLDIIIEEFEARYPSSNSKMIAMVFIPLVTFGLLGVIWSIPFPYLAFLGKYNGFVNWASFAIAFSIYYYYKLSPVLSYGLLLVVFAFSAAFVGLEKLHSHQNWPTMGVVCLGILVLGLVVQYFNSRDENKSSGIAGQFMSLINGPLWLMQSMFSKLGLRV